MPTQIPPPSDTTGWLSPVTALILVGTHASSGTTLPLGGIPSNTTIEEAIAGWEQVGWTDVHCALESITYQRLTAEQAKQHRLATIVRINHEETHP